MRLTVMLCSVLVLGCRDGSTFVLKVQGASLDFSVSGNSAGAGLVVRTETFNPAFSTVTGTCNGGACAKRGRLRVTAPPQSIWAGPWASTEAGLSLVRGDADQGQLLSLDFASAGSSFVVTFGPPTYSASGPTTMFNDGTVEGVAMLGGERVSVSGTLSTEAECATDKPYFIGCGEAPDPAVQRPPAMAVTGDCPAEVTAPFLGAHSWAGNTLKLPATSIDCRITGGVKSSGLDPVFCYQRKTIKAGSCTWDTHFVTDGILLQWQVSAWADGACAQKTCNAVPSR